MGNLSWSIGDVRVTRVVENEVPMPPTGLLPEATPEALQDYEAWLKPEFVTENGDFILSIHGLVVESQGRRILVDTCVGEHQIPGFEALGGANRFLEDLADAGYWGLLVSKEYDGP